MQPLMLAKDRGIWVKTHVRRQGDKVLITAYLAAGGQSRFFNAEVDLAAIRRAVMKRAKKKLMARGVKVGTLWDDAYNLAQNVAKGVTQGGADIPGAIEDLEEGILTAYQDVKSWTEKAVKDIGESAVFQAVYSVAKKAVKIGKAIVKSPITAALVSAVAVAFPPVGVPAAAVFATARIAVEAIEQAEVTVKTAEQAVSFVKDGVETAAKLAKMSEGDRTAYLEAHPEAKAKIKAAAVQQAKLKLLSEPKYQGAIEVKAKEFAKMAAKNRSAAKSAAIRAAKQAAGGAKNRSLVAKQAVAAIKKGDLQRALVLAKKFESLGGASTLRKSVEARLKGKGGSNVLRRPDKRVLSAAEKKARARYQRYKRAAEKAKKAGKTETAARFTKLAAKIKKQMGQSPEERAKEGVSKLLAAAKAIAAQAEHASGQKQAALKIQEAKLREQASKLASGTYKSKAPKVKTLAERRKHVKERTESTLRRYRNHALMQAGRGNYDVALEYARRARDNKLITRLKKDQKVALAAERLKSLSQSPAQKIADILAKGKQAKAAIQQTRQKALQGDPSAQKAWRVYEIALAESRAQKGLQQQWQGGIPGILVSPDGRLLKGRYRMNPSLPSSIMVLPQGAAQGGFEKVAGCGCQLI